MLFPPVTASTVTGMLSASVTDTTGTEICYFPPVTAPTANRNVISVSNRFHSYRNMLFLPVTASNATIMLFPSVTGSTVTEICYFVQLQRLMQQECYFRQ